MFYLPIDSFRNLFHHFLQMMLKMKNKQTNTIQQEDKEPEMNSTKLNSSENDSGTSANNVINLLAELQQHFALISKNNQ